MGILGEPRKCRRGFGAMYSGVYSFEDGYMCLDQMVGDTSSYLEDPERFLRKVRIGVESSIGPILLKTQDMYSNQGKF